MVTLKTLFKSQIPIAPVGHKPNVMHTVLEPARGVHSKVTIHNSIIVSNYIYSKTVCYSLISLRTACLVCFFVYFILNI